MIERMIGQFDDFDEAFLGRDRGDHHAGLLQAVLIVGVEFVAVAVAFVDAVLVAIQLGGLGAGEQDRLAGTEPHGGSHVLDALLFLLQTDHRMFGGLVELGGVRAFQAADVAGELDGGDLHAETDAEIRDLVLAGVLRGEDFPLGAAVAEAAGNEDAVHLADDRLRAVVLDGLGVHADDLHLGVVMGAGVDERFVDRFVGVLQFDVFAGHGDGDLVFRMDHALHEALPILERRGGRVAEAELVHHQAVDLVAAQVERAFVNRVGHIAEGDDVLALDVAEHGDFLPVVLIEVRLGAADDDVRLDADLAEFGDRLLGGFGFHLAGGLDVGQQRDEACLLIPVLSLIPAFYILLCLIYFNIRFHFFKTISKAQPRHFLWTISTNHSP